MTVHTIYTLACDQCGTDLGSESDDEMVLLRFAQRAGWERVTWDILGVIKHKDYCPACVAARERKEAQNEQG